MPAEIVDSTPEEKKARGNKIIKDGGNFSTAIGYGNAQMLNGDKSYVTLKPLNKNLAVDPNAINVIGIHKHLYPLIAAG